MNIEEWTLEKSKYKDKIKEFSMKKIGYNNQYSSIAYWGTITSAVGKYKTLRFSLDKQNYGISKISKKNIQLK